MEIAELSIESKMQEHLFFYTCRRWLITMHVTAEAHYFPGQTEVERSLNLVTAMDFSVILQEF
jgi:hypothetical protein